MAFKCWRPSSPTCGPILRIVSSSKHFKQNITPSIARCLSAWLTQQPATSKAHVATRFRRKARKCYAHTQSSTGQNRPNKAQVELWMKTFKRGQRYHWTNIADATHVNHNSIAWSMLQSMVFKPALCTAWFKWQGHTYRSWRCSFALRISLSKQTNIKSHIRHDFGTWLSHLDGCHNWRPALLVGPTGPRFSRFRAVSQDVNPSNHLKNLSNFPHSESCGKIYLQ